MSNKVMIYELYYVKYNKYPIYLSRQSLKHC